MAPIVAYLSFAGPLGFLGLAGLLAPPATALAAVVVGHVALARAGRYPAGRGRRGAAIAALVLGYLTIAAFVTFIVLLVYSLVRYG